MEYEDMTIGPCIEMLLEKNEKAKRRRFRVKALEREAEDIYNEYFPNLKPSNLVYD